MNYAVFARINKGDDTMYIGGVEAPSDRLARVYAYEMYDEEAWDYLAVVRDEHLLEVAPGTPAVEGGSA